MDTVLPLVLFVLAGVLVGGVLSLRRQGASRSTLLVMGLLAVVAAGGGVLRMLPGS